MTAPGRQEQPESLAEALRRLRERLGVPARVPQPPPEAPAPPPHWSEADEDEGRGD